MSYCHFTKTSSLPSFFVLDVPLDKRLRKPFSEFSCPSLLILLTLGLYYPAQSTAVLQINPRMQIIKLLLYVVVKLLDALNKINHKTAFLL